MSIHMSIHMFIHMPMHMSIHMSVHTSIQMYTHVYGTWARQRGVEAGGATRPGTTTTMLSGIIVQQLHTRLDRSGDGRTG